jgi:hypothetical protein
MKIQELFETQRDKVILIDFQPSYAKTTNYNRALSNVINYINKRDVEVLCLFNGDGFTEDSRDDVIDHFIENGLIEDKIDSFDIHEKTYAFLRSWMDKGVDNNTIIKVLRYMLINHINSSDDIEDDKLEELIDGEYDIDDLKRDSIYFIDLPIAKLKTFSNGLIGGGVRSECFAEIQLVLSLFNIRNKEVQNWIY